jgi:ferredoxin
VVDATPFGRYQLQELFGRGSMGRWTIPRATQGTRSIRRGLVSSPTLGVHRLQGVRGGVQGMERGARRRVQPPRDIVRQHGHAGRETWRHVAFIEQPSSGQTATVASAIKQTARGGGELGTMPVEMGIPKFERPGDATGAESRRNFRWLMSSDVCKHCTHAGCLDVCPTGALFRTEFGTVVVQQDICNGCGYCVSACSYGVLDRGEDDGRAWKCTLCYDRLPRRPGTGVCEGVPDGLSPRLFGEDAADWKMRAEVWRHKDAVIGGSDAGAHRT